MSPDDDCEWSAEELTEEEWHLFIAYCFRDELADPREDVYTLEDGIPSHGPPQPGGEPAQAEEQ